MLSKVIKLSNAGKNVGFGHVIKYVFRDVKNLENGDREPIGEVEGGQFNLDCDMNTPEERAQAAEFMNHTAKKADKQGRFQGNPVYHFSVSWKEGEHPTKQQTEEAVAHTLKALGMDKCEAVWGYSPRYR